MNKPLVLVDSSAWIAYLTAPRQADGRSVEELLRADRVAVNAVIRVEILTGAHDEKQFAELEDVLLGCYVLPLTDAVWRRAERMRFHLRQTGALIPVPDILIACCALVHGCELLHADRHFELIAQRMPLRVYGD